MLSEWNIAMFSELQTRSLVRLTLSYPPPLLPSPLRLLQPSLHSLWAPSHPWPRPPRPRLSRPKTQPAPRQQRATPPRRLQVLRGESHGNEVKSETHKDSANNVFLLHHNYFFFYFTPLFIDDSVEDKTFFCYLGTQSWRAAGPKDQSSWMCN